MTARINTRAAKGKKCSHCAALVRLALRMREGSSTTGWCRVLEGGGRGGPNRRSTTAATWTPSVSLGVATTNISTTSLQHNLTCRLQSSPITIKETSSNCHQRTSATTRPFATLPAGAAIAAPKTLIETSFTWRAASLCLRYLSTIMARARPSASFLPREVRVVP